MASKKQKFGIDSEFYAYGFTQGKKSHVWYSVLPNRRQRIEPLERLKSMLVGKGYEFIQIYKSPYPQANPLLEYKNTIGWYEHGVKSDKISFKLWIASTKLNSNETRNLSSSNLINAKEEAYNLISKNFNNYSDWKFAVLYANKSKSESFKMMHYTIGYHNITQKKLVENI